MLKRALEQRFLVIEGIQKRKNKYIIVFIGPGLKK